MQHAIKKSSLLLGSSALLVTGLLLAGGCSTTLKQQARTDIVAQMSSNRLALRRCYRQALTRNRATKGQVTLHFRVATATGDFEQVSVLQNNLADPVLKGCLLAQVRKLKLPRPTDLPIEVTYPVSFELEPRAATTE